MDKAKRSSIMDKKNKICIVAAATLVSGMPNGKASSGSPAGAMCDNSAQKSRIGGVRRAFYNSREDIWSRFGYNVGIHMQFLTVYTQHSLKALEAGSTLYVKADGLKTKRLRSIILKHCNA